jgi:hypothetical protein
MKKITHLTDTLLAMELRQLDQVIHLIKAARKDYGNEETTKTILSKEIKTMHVSMNNFLDSLDQLEKAL